MTPDPCPVRSLSASFFAVPIGRPGPPWGFWPAGKVSLRFQGGYNPDKGSWGPCGKSSVGPQYHKMERSTYLWPKGLRSGEPVLASAPRVTPASERGGISPGFQALPSSILLQISLVEAGPESLGFSPLGPPNLESQMSSRASLGFRIKGPRTERELR